MKENNLEKLLQNEEEIDLTLSYSKVSDFDRNGPTALIKKAVVKNKGIKIGSLVDDLLFNPEEFKDKYFISEVNEPSATLGVLCKIIIENYNSIPSIEEIFRIIERNEFWKRCKDKTLLQSYFDNDEFWNYLKNHFEIQNRIIITQDEKLQAEEIVSIILKHPFSKQLFDANMDHIYQYAFTIKVDKFTFRGILDIISIDHKNKKIYFKDLKTGLNAHSEFWSSYLKYRYYLQEAIYTIAYEEICKNLQLEGYELMPFEFIYVGLKEKIPVSFIITDKWHTAGKEGFYYDKTYYKGLNQLLDEIYFHWKNKIYNMSKSVYESNGRILLEDNKIELI